MPTLLTRAAPFLRLTRITSAFAAVADTWFVVLWTRASDAESGTSALRAIPEWAALGASAIVAVGLFAFGAALNDIVDIKRDRALHPDRPLPSGRVSVEGAAALVTITLLAAALGATALGIEAVLLCILTAGAILFYNGAAKYIPSVGVVSLGLIYGSHMLIPNSRLVFVWPVWLVMTHALAVAAAVHSVGDRRPKLSKRAITSAALGWLFWSCVLLWVGWRRGGGIWPGWVRPSAAILPGVCVAVFIAVAIVAARSASGARAAADRLQRIGALWLAVYSCAWLLGQGYRREALLLGGFATVGAMGLATAREVYLRFEHPVGYRR